MWLVRRKVQACQAKAPQAAVTAVAGAGQIAQASSPVLTHLPSTGTGHRAFTQVERAKKLPSLGSPELSLHPLLNGGCAGAVEDAGGGADVHVQGGADVGVAGDGGDVGGVEFPGEQGGGAQDVAQAVPGPGAVAVLVAPAGQVVGGGQDAAVEVGGPPPGAAGGGEQQPERVGAGVLLGPGLPRCGRRSSRRAGSRPGCGRGRWSCGACGPWVPRRSAGRRPR